MQEQEFYFDAHNHLLDYTPEELNVITREAFENGVLYCAPNATREAEYARMLDLAQQFPLGKQGYQGLQVVPSFGIHPYFLQYEADNPNWQSSLQKVISLNERFCIGQIGIDYRKDVLEINSKQTQHHFFIRQLEMSFLANRPVTVHCVRAHDDLLKILKKYNHIFQKERKGMTEREIQLWKAYKCNPIIMHSYGGSKGMTKSLMKLTSLNIYFSLCLNRSQDLCTVIPLEKLLLETDAPHQNNVNLLKQEGLFEGEVTPEVQKENEKKNKVHYVKANIRPLCEYYQIDRYAFSRAVFQNAKRVFRILK